jgi:hypothetical protein
LAVPKARISRLRSLLAGLLVLLAIALVAGIVSLHDWGGRIEAQLMVFGDRLWVTFDAGLPRVFLLMTIPAILLAVAVSLFRRRPGE